MSLQDRLQEDFARLIDSTETRSISVAITYNHVRTKAVDPETGDLTKSTDQVPLQAIRTLYNPDEKQVQNEFIAPGTITFFVLAEDKLDAITGDVDENGLGLTPTKDDFITYNLEDYEVFHWQLDNDENVYRFYVRKIKG